MIKNFFKKGIQFIKVNPMLLVLPLLYFFPEYFGNLSFLIAGAIAFDAGTNGASGSSPLTFSHTVTGSDPILLVGVEINGTTSVSGITYNGVALTKINSIVNGVFTHELWYLSDPATGANDVVVTTTGAVTLLNASAVSYTGASNPSSAIPDNDGVDQGSVGTGTNTIVSVADNCFHIAFFAGRNTGNNLTAGSGATARNVTTSGFAFFDSNGVITPAGSNSMTVTVGGGDFPMSNGVTIQPTIPLTTEVIQKSLAYYINKAIGITKSLHYEVLAPVSINKSLKYTVATTPSPITKSLQYLIGKTISITKSLEYLISKAISVTKSLQYLIKSPVDLQKSLKYTAVTTPIPELEDSEDFEAGLGNWVNATGDEFDWTRHSGSTPSSATGPDSGQGVSSYYMYIETSSPRVLGDEAWLEYTKINNAGGKIEFYYHMYGSGINELKVQAFNGSSWSDIFTKSGQQHTSSSEAYTKAEAIFPDGTTKLRFVGIRGSNFEGDIAIDTIDIYIKTSKSLKYTILKSINIQKALDYFINISTDIQKSLKYTIKKGISVTKNLKYVVLSPVAINKSLKYTITTTPSALTKSLQYDIVAITTIKITKSLQYLIKSIQSVTKDLKYTIKATPSPIAKSLEYFILIPLGITKSLKYTILKSNLIQKSLKYAVTVKIAITKNLIYSIVTSTTQQKSLAYSVLLPTAIQKSIIYSILTSGVIQKSLTYVIESPFSIVKNLKYTILTSIVIQKSLKYEVMYNPYSKTNDAYGETDDFYTRTNDLHTAI